MYGPHVEVEKLARPSGLARSARNWGRAGSLNYWPEKTGPNLARPVMASPARIFFCLEKTIWPYRPGF